MKHKTAIEKLKYEAGVLLYNQEETEREITAHRRQLVNLLERSAEEEMRINEINDAIAELEK